MEATLLGSHHFRPPLFVAKHICNQGGKTTPVLQCYRRLYAKSHISLKKSSSGFSRRHFVLPNRPYCSKENENISLYFQGQRRGDHMSVKATSAESLTQEVFVPNVDNGVPDDKNLETLQSRPKTFKNRYLNFVRLASLLNGVAESFFKSEICRRLFMTAFLLAISRVGYFVPLPSFDRRLIPEDYLSFVSGSVDELGDFAPELKLSLFQLGISPQIAASILMQVLCHLVPSLVKLRKEGLDGHEKIKSYMCV